MHHQKIKSFFLSAIHTVESKISQYAVHPGKDLTRTKKLPPGKLMNFLVSQGSSSTKNELLDFFDMDTNRPTASALNQQRAKLKPEALEAVFHEFNSLVSSIAPSTDYRFLAADGSTFTFFSKPSFAPPEYYVSEGHSARGFYSIHLNALFDLTRHTYTDAFLQPVHKKDEFRAFCNMVDNHVLIPGTKDVFIGDRGYCSYNNMAHKPEYIKQEIWARLIVYNITETLINHTVVKHGDTKHEYKVNFSVAAHICRVFLRPYTEKDPIDVMSLLEKELIPIRNERQYPRLKTAHFRRPRYFIYRAA